MSNIIDKIQLSGVTYDIGGSGSVSTAITSGDTNAVAGGAVYDKFDEVEQVTAEALNDINDRVSEDEEVTAAALNTLNTNKQDKLSAGTGISISGNVISATGGGGGNPTVELTQAEYDALVTAGTVSADTYYIITDATPVDMSNYYTSAQTNTLLAGKQDTLSAGTGIEISGNVISATGGGSSNLPISAGTGTNSIKENYSNNTASGNYSHAEGLGTTANNTASHAEGYGTKASGTQSHAEGYYATASGTYSHAEGSNTTANGNHSHAEGYSTIASGNASHAEGYNTKAQNDAEHASGRYNVSSKANTTFGDSGNTLFSVGNGTSLSARHNAFEIRQNGDIYLSSGGTDIKLQDHLGGGGSGTVSSAITRGDTNAVAGGAVYNRFDEVEQVTAQALNVLNESLSGKQDTLSAGTNITIVDNVISAEGGGSTYTAGDGINITNDVISVTGKTNQSDFTTHTANTTVHVTAQDKTNWNAKSDFSGSYNDLTNKLSAGTNITIVDNVISAEGGGGKAVSGGTNISVTTGETADTINCTLPLTVGSSNKSLSLGVGNNLNSSNRTLAIGDGNTIGNLSTNSLVGGMRSSINYNCGNSIAFGYEANVGSKYSYSIGTNTKTSNQFESAFGLYNASNTGSTNADKTLFSVGNGTNDKARHNVFEIRKNGDIYLTKDGQDVKLQDQLGGGGSSYSAGTGIDITNDVISVTGMTDSSAFTAHTGDTTIHVTSSDKTSWNGAATNASNAVTALGGLKLVKLSQSAYDNLQNKDSNTLYVIVN